MPAVRSRPKVSANRRGGTAKPAAPKSRAGKGGSAKLSAVKSSSKSSPTKSSEAVLRATRGEPSGAGKAKPRRKSAATTKNRRGRVKRGAARGRSRTVGEHLTLAARAAQPYAVVLTVAFLLLIVAMFWMGGYFNNVRQGVAKLSERAALKSGFAIEDVYVRDNKTLSDETIRAALGTVDGQSLLHFDANAARARLEALGWVRQAAVGRLWPDALVVSVAERSPVAVWQRGGELQLIDSDGVVITPVATGDFMELPLLVGEDAANHAAALIGDLERFEEIRTRVTAAVRVGERRWNLRLRSGADIRLPEESYEEALSTLAQLQDARGVLDQKLEYIDFRNPDQVIFRPASAERARG